MEDFDFFYKILLLGDSGIGKSCLLLKFTENEFHENLISTLGVDFHLKTIDIDGKKVKLQIWDCAGQEKFRSITYSYYRGAHGIVLGFDVTNRLTFEHIKSWVSEIKQNCPNFSVPILIGTKIDLPNRRVSYQEALELANSLGMQYIETSAKSGLNVSETFTDLSQTLIKKRVPCIKRTETIKPKPKPTKFCCLN